MGGHTVRQARGFDSAFGLDKLKKVIAMANVAFHYPKIGDFPFSLALSDYNKDAFIRVKTALIDLDDLRLALVSKK